MSHRVRIASIQYMLRPVKDFDDFAAQVDFALNAAEDYDPDYVLLPEIFTIQLLSCLETKEVEAAVRDLAENYTDRIVEHLRRHAMEKDTYLIGGSHPTIHDGQLYNTSYLFTPTGAVHTQDKIHRTRWEKDDWKTTAGQELKVFETEHCPIAILICYDVEFPELARMACEAGAEILFVPSCTDDRQGFLRVRYCCHARAIENQVFVVMTSTVGNLPAEGLHLHYGQASIITPSDFPFSRDGIAAEGSINQEQIIVADVDLDLLDEARIKGTTIPLEDKRQDIYQTVARREQAPRRSAKD